jgi:hypothetical protein
MEKIREWLLWKIMNNDEKRIWLKRKAQLLHQKEAKIMNYVGHCSDCCDRELLK